MLWLMMTMKRRKNNMFSKETKIALMRDRQKLLAARDPAGNANIIAKLTRRIRQLEKQ